MQVTLNPSAHQRPVLELAIEELVLSGFSPGDRYRIGEALERELAQLLTEQGIPPSLYQPWDLDVLQGDSLQIATRARPEAIGLQLAQAIYSKLSSV